MKNKRIELLICVILLLTVLSLSVVGQAIDTSKVHGKISLADLGLKHGVLANGFAYYVQRDENLKGRILVKLIVKFGEQHVPENQTEYPHLIEHLATLKTKHVSSVKTLVKDLGLALGNDFNAGTNAKTTNYWMNIFSATPKHLEQVFQLYRDVAQGGVVITDATVAKEKLVVLEEYRTNSEQPEPKIAREYLLKLMGPSACTQAALAFYTNDRSTIRSTDPRVLKELYDTWYRPDLEAIIVTGDIDVNKVQKEIITLFSSLKNYGPPPNSPTCATPVIPQISYTRVTNSPLSRPEIRLISRSLQRALRSEDDFENATVKKLINVLVTNRLLELKLAPSYISFQSTFNDYGVPFGIATTSVVAGNYQNLKPEFIRMQTEIERMRRYGFTDGEIKTATESILKNLEKDLSTPFSLSNQYVSHFTQGTAVLSKQVERELATRKLSQPSRSEITDEVNSLLGNPDRHIVVVGTKEVADALPDERTVLSWLDSIKTIAIEPLQEEKTELLTRLTELIPMPLTNASPAKAPEQLTKIGVTKLMLPNGVTVLCKPVPPANADEKGIIYLGATNPYRSTQAHAVITEITTGVISSSGVGPYSGEAWRKYQDQQQFSVNPFILSNRSGFNGRGRARAITDMLLSIHAYFTQPRIDSDEFERNVADQHTRLLAKKRPVDLYIDAANERTAVHSSMYATNADVALVDTLSERYILNLYKNEFYDPSEFTFVVTGDFNVESVKEQLLFYLGTIPVRKPSPERHATHTQLRSIRDTTLYTGQSGKGAKLTLQYFAPVDYNFKTHVELEVISNLLNSVVFSTIRERDGLAYSAGAFGYFSNENAGLTIINAWVDCDKNNREDVSVTLKKEIELACNNPDSRQVQAARTSVLAEYEKGSKDPMFWKNYLLRQLFYQDDLERIAKVKTIIETMDRRNIKELSNKILKDGRSRQIMLVPGVEGVAN